MEDFYMTREEIIKKLENNGQMHIIKAYDRADQETKKILEEQIERIDFNQVNDLFETTKNEINPENDLIESIAYVEKASLNENDYNKYLKLGEDAIREGKYAVKTRHMLFVCPILPDILFHKYPK